MNDLRFTIENNNSQYNDYLHFVHEDFIIVDKPSNLIVHSTVDKQRVNLFDILKTMFPSRKVSILHRLDKETSGLMLFSLNPNKNTIFQKMFDDRSIRKIYWAEVVGESQFVEQTLLKNYLEIQRVKGIDKSIVVSKNGKIALSKAKNLQCIVSQDKNINSTRSLVEVELVTGRMHQIRAQLAHHNLPIVHDILYGKNLDDTLLPSIKKNSNRNLLDQDIEPNLRLHLHSYRLIFSFEGQNFDFQSFPFFSKKFFQKENDLHKC